MEMVQGKPTGIFDATHGGHLLNTLSAGIKSDDMLDLVYGLKRPYRKGASFIMNDGTLAQLRKLKDNNGCYIGSHLIRQGSRIMCLVMKYILLRMLRRMPFPLVTTNTIISVIGGSRSFKQLNELFVGNGMIGYVAKERVDGKLILPEAVQIIKLKGAE